jgi:Trk-type K+ transport system membrane component
MPDFLPNYIIIVLVVSGGMQYPIWLSHYTTSQRIAGSIPDEVI